MVLSVTSASLMRSDPLLFIGSTLHFVDITIPPFGKTGKPVKGSVHGYHNPFRVRESHAVNGVRVLDWSRESGRIKIQFESLDLAGLVQKTLNTLGWHRC